MKRTLHSIYLSLAFAVSPAIAADATIGPGCSLSGNAPVIGFGLVCSEIIVTSSSIAGSPLRQQSFLSDQIIVSGSGTNGLTAGSGLASARTSFGSNGAESITTATHNASGQVTFILVSDAYSTWYDTFYISSAGHPYTINLNWTLDGLLSSGASFGDDALMEYSMTVFNQNVTLAALRLTGLPGFGLSDDFGSNGFTAIGSGPFERSGTATIVGTGDAAFVLGSRLFTAASGNGMANILSTARIGFTLAVGTPTITDASGLLAFNGTEFAFPGPTAVPEPETYAMMLAGLGLLGFATRRRKSQSS